MRRFMSPKSINPPPPESAAGASASRFIDIESGLAPLLTVTTAAMIDHMLCYLHRRGGNLDHLSPSSHTHPAEPPASSGAASLWKLASSYPLSRRRAGASSVVPVPQCVAGPSPTALRAGVLALRHLSVVLLSWQCVRLLSCFGSTREVKSEQFRNVIRSG
jgi:hypothetical protein